jgi:hypothetical protein
MQIGRKKERGMMKERVTQSERGRVERGGGERDGERGGE